MPSISELEKSVEPSPAQTAADQAAAESLRALRQKDSMRIGPPVTRDSRQPKTETPISGLPAESSVPVTSASDVSAGGIVPLRRKARLTDFARILLPKSTETLPETTATSFPDKPPGAVVPAAFPVAGTAGSVIEPKTESGGADSPNAPSSSQQVETKVEPVDQPPKPSSDSSETTGKPPTPGEAADFSLKDTTRVTFPPPVGKPPQDGAPSTTIEPVQPPPDLREKREFILANGERILGHILSESADTIYVDHPTLGVLTLPRAQIAGKPIEVILINGDRIVGNLIAETTECLYIRHASLGMLTVPHGQRSTRVVEAILKDGDRILGEVLAETDNFTVIRSATLGTVAVQHEQVAMLNRKIEQMQLRALPAPALGDAKSDGASS